MAVRPVQPWRLGAILAATPMVFTGCGDGDGVGDGDGTTQSAESAQTVGVQPTGPAPSLIPPDETVAIGTPDCSALDWCTQYGDADFVWGFGVDSAETLKIALVSFNMAEDDADCAVEAIFTSDFAPDPQYGDEYSVQPDMLEEAVAQCDIDTSRIWRSWD